MWGMVERKRRESKRKRGSDDCWWKDSGKFKFNDVKVCI
jgi:hypothetical protein